MSRAYSTLFKTILLFESATALLPVPAFAAPQENWKLSAYYPFQYYVTKNENGSAGSYTLAGVGFNGVSSLYGRSALLFNTEFTLNASTSAILFQGYGVALGYQFLGSDMQNKQLGEIALKSTSSMRAAVYFGICMREFDFRSLIGSDSTKSTEIIDPNKSIESQGNFWAPFSRISFEHRLQNERYVGIFLQGLRSLDNSVLRTQITSLSFGIHYEFYTF